MLNINYLISIFLLSTLAFFNSNTMAIGAVPGSESCGVTKTIQANEWAQIGIPCEAPAGQNTVEAHR